MMAAEYLERSDTCSTGKSSVEIPLDSMIELMRWAISVVEPFALM